MEEITYIIHKLLKQEPLSVEERQVFDIWNSEPANEKTFAKYIKLWKVVEPEQVLSPNLNEQWDRFKLDTINKKKNRSVKLLRNAGAVAAVLIICIGIFTLFQTSINSNQTFVSEQLPIEINLEDGSIVYLNSNSSLKVVKAFNKQTRTVKLYGEGLFKVNENKEVPFIVKLDNGLDVKVLGTEFNIRSVEGGQRSELKVLSGKVLFEKNNKGVILTKNEEIDFDHANNNFSNKREVNANLLAWYTKKFDFDNTPIEEVAESLKHFINKEIELPANNGELRYSGSFNNPTAKDIAEVISIAMGWNFKITDKAIIFSEK